MPTDDELWRAAARERAALADDLATLTPEQWRRPSLCRGWGVEEVVAHLTAAASLGRGAWLRSMAGARFRSAVPSAWPTTRTRPPWPRCSGSRSPATSRWPAAPRRPAWRCGPTTGRSPPARARRSPVPRCRC
ncbi:maleylpyruvate isomerase N-terminal domain-containing protein [Klenkia terrae]|uniref:maleylpyruvate isomerase N-terminal domain-containing protein n=1 Tax=Klenkia terrae TaxID=1052259 RepID=UPI00362213DF